MKYSVYKSEMGNLIAGYYELTGNTPDEVLIEKGYVFVCFARTAKDADKLAGSIWVAK